MIPKGRPNIVFILADQLRADFLGCYGADFVDTPNIDSLAARGVKFERAYSTTPLCVPARAKLLTGAGPGTTGIVNNGQWLRPGFESTGLQTWPKILSSSGYRTAAIGKMHFYPWDERHGFEHRIVSEDKRWINVQDDYWYYLKDRGYRKYHGNEHEGYHENQGAIINKIPWEHSVDRFVGAEAAKYIDTYNEPAPFAMMVGFPGPHCPYDPSQEFLDRVSIESIPEPIDSPGIVPLAKKKDMEGQKRAWNGVDYSIFTLDSKMKLRAHYAALVNQIDVEVGRIVYSLEKQGILDDTVIILSSDHGDYLGDHNMVGKNSFFEAAIHVPLIVSGRGTKPGVTSDIVDLGDITSTILQLSGNPIPEYMDSIPLLRMDQTASLPPKRDYLIGTLGGGWMIYNGKFKLCRYTTGENAFFDLEQNPNETINSWSDPIHTARRDKMDTALVNVMMESFSASHSDKLAHAAWDNLDLAGKAGNGPYRTNKRQSSAHHLLPF